MASSRRSASIWLGLGLCGWMVTAEAQQPAPGTTLLVVGPTRAGCLLDSASPLLATLAQTLAADLGHPVSWRLAPPDMNALIEDLASLPQRLRELAAGGTLGECAPRILLVRLTPGPDDLWGVEAALVDREAPALLAYGDLAHHNTVSGADLPSAVAAFVHEARPGGRTTALAADSPLPPVVTLADAARDSLGEALLNLPRTRRNPVELTPARRKRALSTAPSEAELLMNAVSGGLMAPTLGTAADRPRVCEASWQTLLMPVTGADGAIDPLGQPVKVGCNLYSTEKQYLLEMRFSRAVTVHEAACDGGWTVCDLSGFRAVQDETATLDAAGAVTLRVRPGDQADRTRLGVLVRGASPTRFEVGEGGRRVELAVTKDSAPVAEPVEAPRVTRTLTGRASWYGGSWHGRQTASGERFDSGALTAAHRTLPLGTYVRVTNLGNGRQVVVRINDRGPFVGGRVLDVSRGAAELLGFISSGVCSVQLEVLDGRG